MCRLFSASQCSVTAQMRRNLLRCANTWSSSDGSRAFPDRHRAIPSACVPVCLRCTRCEAVVKPLWSRCEAVEGFAKQSWLERLQLCASLCQDLRRVCDQMMQERLMVSCVCLCWRALQGLQFHRCFWIPRCSVWKLEARTFRCLPTWINWQWL